MITTPSSTYPQVAPWLPPTREPSTRFVTIDEVADFLHISKWMVYNQIQQIKKMGNIKDLAAMIPGVGKAIRDVDIPEDAFKGVEAIIQSMTPKERTNPAILNTSRRQRIAKGSGTNIQEVNKLIKQFDQTRKMMQMMTGNKMAQMMSRMKGMPGMPKIPGM